MAVPQRTLDKDYLAMDRASEIKHEMIDGQVIAGAGGSYNHATLPASIAAAFLQQTRGQGCMPSTSDLRVKVGELDYYYPDVTVVCGKPELIGDDVLLNPSVVVEVHSPSTRKRDRQVKLLRYLQIPSLRAILFVEPDRMEVGLVKRTESGFWDWVDYVGPDAVVKLDQPEASLRLADIYAGLELEPV